jgi:hypothetical protein
VRAFLFAAEGPGYAMGAELGPVPDLSGTIQNNALARKAKMDDFFDLIRSGSN